jgi:two-component system, chemotaxis family, CheB/CheR fusion protein
MAKSPKTSPNKTTKKMPQSPASRRRPTPVSEPPASLLTVPIVGVGASAGGLEAFTLLLKHLPTDTGMGFVLVQHLDPNHQSVLAHLLTQATSMPVLEAKNNFPVKANHVYVIPPNTSLTIIKGVLKLAPRSASRGLHLSIDSFFESLAQDQLQRAIGVVLSGTASDGTRGLEAIKAEGGITFAQNESAKYDSMPRSAIAAGCVDFVMSPLNIAREIARIAKHPYVAGSPQSDHAKAPAKSNAKPGAAATGPQNHACKSSPQGEPDTDPSNTQKILLLLRNHCGVDFTLYRLNTIHRRISRRMVLNRHSSLDKYIAFLKGNHKELDALFSDILINVTSFFRNPDTFKTLKLKVFPELLKIPRNRDEPVRVWTPACSTGQEPYSIAMAFAEFSQTIDRAPRLQIFATDLNDAVLEKARRALYSKSLIQDLSADRLERFFVQEDGGYRVSKPLREQVVFARQNVLCDPPFSRMDLISCRNLLIYLEPALQNKLIPAFHYALKPGGFLVLGASEAIGQFSDLFTATDKKQKIFCKTSLTPVTHTPPEPKPNPFHWPAPRAAATIPKGHTPPDPVRGGLDAQREADRVIANRFAPPSVLVNADFQILQFRGATADYLKPPSGKATFDLLKMAQDGLMAPLRAAINKAKRAKKPVRQEAIRVHHKGGDRKITIQVLPLRNLKDLCYLVIFENTTPNRPSTPPDAPATKVTGNKQATRQIANLERELAETREYLQSIQEENDLANEELQSFGEEVQSSNEELQSINEELETSKEELESSNEELTTVNEEMAHRGTELSRLNTDLNNLQVSIDTAIILFSLDLTIRRFTPTAQKLFNLLPTDIGRPLGGIRHNLNLTDLERLLTQTIDTATLSQRDIQDKTGHWYSLRAHPYMNLDNKIDGVVLMLVDIDALKSNEQKITAVNDYAQAILRAARDPLVVLRADLRINTANTAFYALFDLTAEQATGQSLLDLCADSADIPALRKFLVDTHANKIPFDDFEITLNLPAIGKRTMLLNAGPLESNDTTPGRIILVMRDITRRVAYEAERQALLASEQDARAQAQAANRAKDVFLATLSHELRTPLSAIMAWATLLRCGKINPSDHQEGLSVIERNVRVQTQLIDDVLDISRIVSGKLRLHIVSADLKAVVTAAITVVQASADAKQIKLQTTFQPTGSVMCDPVRMQQVVWNLISNAIKFTPDHGTVRISLSLDQNHACIQVQDDGVGIPADFLPFVFDRFRQADGSTTKQHGGLGLGLSIVKHIVEQHGGTVAVESPGESRGARFFVRLPVHPVIAQTASGLKTGTDAPAAVSPHAPQDILPARLDNLVILVVDDQADTRHLLAKVLHDAGAKVTCVESAQLALAALDSTHPDILVSDIGMPFVDGFELMRRIRAAGHHPKELPAVALTAFAHNDDRARALAAGFQEHVAKPVDPYELTGILARLTAHN